MTLFKYLSVVEYERLPAFKDEEKKEQYDTWREIRTRKEDKSGEELRILENEIEAFGWERLDTFYIPGYPEPPVDQLSKDEFQDWWEESDNHTELKDDVSDCAGNDNEGTLVTMRL